MLLCTGAVVLGEDIFHRTDNDRNIKLTHFVFV